MNIRDGILALVLTHAMPAAAAAQEQQSAPARKAEACRQAIEIVTAGAALPERREALAYLPRCGAEGGRAMAQELRRLSATSDSATLLKSYYQIARIVDASVLAAALELAEDESATSESRIIAFKVLISFKNPAFTSVPFSGFLPGNPRTVSVQDHFGTNEGSPLPANWQISAREVLERLAANPQGNETIRHAARRALSLFRH